MHSDRICITWMFWWIEYKKKTFWEWTNHGLVRQKKEGKRVNLLLPNGHVAHSSLTRVLLARLCGLLSFLISLTWSHCMDYWVTSGKMPPCSMFNMQTAGQSVLSQTFICGVPTVSNNRFCFEENKDVFSRCNKGFSVYISVNASKLDSGACGTD